MNVLKCVIPVLINVKNMQQWEWNTAGLVPKSVEHVQKPVNQV